MVDGLLCDKGGVAVGVATTCGWEWSEVVSCCEEGEGGGEVCGGGGEGEGVRTRGVVSEVLSL